MTELSKNDFEEFKKAVLPKSNARTYLTPKIPKEDTKPIEESKDAIIEASAIKSIDERKKILQEKILEYVKEGWKVSNQFETSAQLTRETSPSCGIAFLLALFLLIPAVLYLIFYKGKETIFIEVDEQGEVHITENK